MDHHGDTVRHLRGSKFLRAASDSMINELAGVVETVSLAAGAKVFEKEDVGKSMYVVVDGIVRVHDGTVLLKRLHSGEVFGEIAALASDTRTSSVTAETDSTLLKLDRDSLYSTLSTYPDAARTIIQALCEKERDIVHDVAERTIKVSVLERELEIGAKIQRGFLPERLPQVPGWDIAAHLHPAREVAGDFYDCFSIKTLNSLAVVIGDVCDKGVGAALFMTLFRSLLRSAALADDFTGWANSASNNAAPGVAKSATAADRAATLIKSITLTNNYIATTHRRSSMFASVFFGLLQPDTGELIYINAGHEAPALVGTSGLKAKLEPTGAVIGLFPEARYEVGTVQLESGDLLLGYTDGVTEAKNEANEQFSEDRLIEILRRSAGTAASVLSGIVNEVGHFTGSAPQHDDITLLALKRGAD